MANQETSNRTITVADGRPKHPCKLRQTCDPCSEAKVKCDKGNPRCGRCDRLSYDCVYSPARRIGRPRPRSRRSPDQDSWGCPARDARDARDGGASASTNETVNKDYTAPGPALPLSAQAPAQATQQQTSAVRDSNLIFDEFLLDCLSDESRWSGPASVSVSSSTSARISDRGSSRINDAAHSTRTSMMDGLLGSSFDKPLSLGMEEIPHDPYEYDCAAVAVATLGKLAAAGLDSQQSATPQTTQAAAAADILADQIPHACRQAARILVCPCSSDMDTALLAASLAAAILDVANAALRTLKPAGHALDEEQHTVLALGTIPNISRVVTLFTHRYSVTQVGRPSEALLLLAASLRTTLKSMAEETTNRFLDSGTARSPRRETN
ncbi:sterol regulatory element-binding protein ECM22 [Colletotrichum spaethianum]|uniref:Sterol regulatory element-binding protein ECM22 n=1 Tax=Colletotrichum spaethianum TaxID=700344 RepID=A0AA37PCR4_9PEZI|nr:sterol regulatory element-binding protein ECM22 [Colletotrichum spaethianum]GKT49750.1 sterol regulatory element-binding protein ECM22 [Colletotrichum spaethianum]